MSMAKNFSIHTIFPQIQYYEYDKLSFVDMLHSKSFVSVILKHFQEAYND